MNSTRKIIFTTLLIEKSPQALPLGAACCASAVKHSALTKDWCDTKMITFNCEDEEFYKISEGGKNFEAGGKFIAKKLMSAKPDLVAFSVYVWNRNFLEKASELLRNEGILTIAGGPEITAHPEVFTSFDRVISGEGEIKVPAAICELLNEKTNSTGAVDLPNTKINSPSADELSKNKINLPSASSPDLNTLYSPYLDGTLDPSEFGGALWELARGCPFKCSYCYESKGEKTVRLFPMERIKAELDLFAKKKVPQVFVLDPTYNANKQRAIELLNLIAKKTPDTFYYFEARAEFIDRQMAHAFTKIPCAVQIGLQTANEEAAKAVHRPFNRKIFSRNIGLLNQEGVIFGLDLIYGLPLDTFKSFKESVDFACNLYPNNLEIFCLSVLPGTDIFDRAKELKLNFDENPPYHVINTDRFSKADLEICKKIADGCSLFYNDGRAVPWFNTICKALKIRASQFFLQFEEWMEKQEKSAEKEAENNCLSTKTHREIEELQVRFVTELLNQKNKGKLVKAATDLIRLNGAISRKTDTGKDETVNLNYSADYLESEYAFDLEFFVQNVKLNPNKLRI